MKEIKLTKFEANDGKQFDTEAECTLHETYIVYLELIMAFMGNRPDDSDFANGGGYIQHDIHKVNIAKEEFVGLVNMTYGTNYGFGFIGRMLDDGNDDMMSRAWGRLNCVDKKGREWGQPFFAANPTKGKQVEFKEK